MLTTSHSPVARRDIVALILAATCWGVGTVISKAALDEIPPFTLLPIQLAASLVLLGLLMRRQGSRFEPKAHRCWADSVSSIRVSPTRLA